MARHDHREHREGREGIFGFRDTSRGRAHAIIGAFERGHMVATQARGIRFIGLGEPSAF